jgi:hypothetical protein
MPVNIKVIYNAGIQLASYKIHYNFVLNKAVCACATYSINWMVFITEMKTVYSAVRTGSLNEAVCACATYSINW